MTSKFVRIAVLAAVMAAPFAVHADNDVRACAKAYIAENFADRATTVRVNDYTINSPLILRNRSQQKIALKATGAESGRLFGQATCTTKEGTVTVTPVAQ